MLVAFNDFAQDALAEAIRFAAKTNQLTNLIQKLNFLANYANEVGTRCTLFKDFAPYSFTIIMEKEDYLNPGEFIPWFGGGLVYHGPHDNGGDGGAPTFSVNLNNSNGWSIHT
jgi:hypothetical protein